MAEESETAALRALPSVDEVARLLPGDHDSRDPNVIDQARRAVAEAREAIFTGARTASAAEIAERASDLLEASRRSSLRRVVNASGVILHTNLGRAPLSERATTAVQEIAGGYSNLEFDLDEGRRGTRYAHARDLIGQVTGAEDALVVNNNAAALFFVLQVFAAGRNVVVSRGEAVEIGGGFRIPDVVAQSGALITEVGTTNRTYARDYADAMTESSAAILRVHTSNFRVIGFTARASTEELAEVAHAKQALLIDDLGSGALVPTEQFGLPHEPTVRESVAAGADLVLFSGDKLLGGPQCGIIAGRADLIDQLRRHPLARVLRVDKMALAALNATLQSYVDRSAGSDLAPWSMLAIDLESIRTRAQQWVDAVGSGEVLHSRTMVGGGSLPGAGVDSYAAAVEGPNGPERLAADLRGWRIPIVARIENQRVLLDPRTVEPSDDPEVAEALSTLTAR